MVQMFGKRILGGIGAPGGGMAESFGAGVSTTLGQRESRQAMDERAQMMRMRDIDLQWRTEDREEAKRMRAAAEAAAAASRARAEANRAQIAQRNAAYRGVIGAMPAVPPVAGLTMGGATAPAAPAVPAAVGVRVPGPTPALSYGERVSGGAGSPALGGGGGGDTLSVSTSGAPAAGLAARPGPFLAQMADQRAAERAAATAVLQAPPVSRGALQGAKNTLRIAEAKYTQNPTNETLQALIAAQQTLAGLEGQMSTEAAAMTQPTYADRGVLALEGGEGMVAATPQPRAQPLPPQVTVTLPGGEQMQLSTGVEAPAPPRPPLTFGERLGAQPASTGEIFVEELLSRTGTESRPLPVITEMGTPGEPDAVVRNLLSAWEQQQQLAQLSLQYDDMATFAQTQEKLRDLQVGLEAATGRLAINEMRYRRAPQRLSAIWTEYTGMNYEFRPGNDGAVDVYIDGQLYQRNAPLSAIATETLGMTDAAYRERQAQLEGIRGEAEAKSMGEAAGEIYQYQSKAQVDLQKALAEGLTEMDLLAMRRDLGFDVGDAIDFQTDANTGIIVVFRNGQPAGQYAPTSSAGPTGQEITRFERVQ